MSAPEPAPAPPDSAIARIPGVIFAPVKTFEAIARRPTWLAPLLLWTALSLVLTSVMMPRMDWEGMTRAQMETLWILFVLGKAGWAAAFG